MKTYLRCLTVLIFLAGLFLLSCEDQHPRQVKYIATEAISPYTITYLDQAGNLVKQTIQAQNLRERWEYSFKANKGDLVYISGFYKDIHSSLRLMILVDGKVYKQGYSAGDTVRFLTVSGVVPY